MDAKAIEAAIAEYIRPQTFPVAARFCAGPEEFPPKTRRPKRDLGVEVAICQTVGIARRYGWLLGLTEEDLSCPFGMVAFGFAKDTPAMNAGEYCAGLYTATPEAGARSEATVPRLEYSPTKALLIGPLARWEGPFDVVAVYANSAQVMRLAQAALYREGGAIQSFTTGRIDCSVNGLSVHRPFHSSYSIAQSSTSPTCLHRFAAATHRHVALVRLYSCSSIMRGDCLGYASTLAYSVWFVSRFRAATTPTIRR